MKRWQQTTLLVLFTIAAVYGMIYADVVLRAKEAYSEGEKYMRWADHPEERAKYLDEKMAADKATLERDFAKGKLVKDDYERDLELIQFDHDLALKESSLKYAYVWYQTAVQLFSPPNSKWVQMAREKMPIAKERWKAELRAQNIPFEEYMIE